MQPSPQPPRIPVVAVVNTSQEITDLLQAVFQVEGFEVATAFTLDIKRGRLDFDRFLAEHRPDAVVWDIAIPYEENWALFQRLRDGPAGRRCRFVLTTTNKAALQGLVGEVPVHEIVGKPFDLDEIVGAVRRSLGGESAPHPDEPGPDETPAARSV